MSMADLMEAMAAAGAPMEAIVIAVRAIEEKDAILAAKRAVERDRKRKQRGTVTGQSRDTDGTVPGQPSPQSPPLKSPPDPQKITPPLTPQPLGMARAKFAAPDGVTAEQWKAFRQQRKKPLNERSYALLCNKLVDLAEAGWPPGEMIDLAIERGWETVFEPKDQGNGKTHRGINGLAGNQSGDGLSPTTRAARAVFGPIGAGH